MLKSKNLPITAFYLTKKTLHTPRTSQNIMFNYVFFIFKAVSRKKTFCRNIQLKSKGKFLWKKLLLLLTFKRCNKKITENSKIEGTFQNLILFKDKGSWQVNDIKQSKLDFILMRGQRHLTLRPALTFAQQFFSLSTWCKYSTQKNLSWHKYAIDSNQVIVSIFFDGKIWRRT